MSTIINTNSLSLLTQNNLTKSQASLNTAIQRLSSGVRINSAKDDAAGQAIANRFTANIKGLTQAQRNANDGISLAQTTEGALNEVNTNLQRIRELTVQSANGSNSADDKVSIQAEIVQRMSEIDRTSTQTDFNGTKVLAATKDLKIQIGANDSETINIGLKEISISSLSLTGFSVSGNALKVGPAVTSFTTANATTAIQNTDLSAAATALTAATGKAVVASDLSLNEVQNAAGTGTGQFVVKYGQDFYAASKDISTGSTGGVKINTVSVSFADAANGVTTANAVTQTKLVKVGATSTGAAEAFATVEGKNYSVNADGLASSGTATATTGTSVYTAAAPIQLSAGSGVIPTAQYAGGASANPVKTIDDALKIVDTLRGSLGAVQNRFDSVISNLGTTITNLSASRSRIEDADYATEVSNLTRAQILQQAGTSVLAKANQSTEGVLSLLR